MHPPAFRRLRLPLAAVFLSVWIAQPVLAAGPAPPPPIPPDAAAPIEVTPAIDAALPPAPAPSTTSPGAERIAMQLVELGWAESDATVAAAQLTPGDLRVLLAHPKMMQNAGTSSTYSQGVIVGILVLAGLIALAAAGDGSITTSF